MCFALCACTGVHHYTYEIEYTTDREAHTVQLWYDEGRRSDAKLVYSLTFPQSYYAYRDNHDAEKQTTIGLILDRRTLRPLTELAASETGISEPLEMPRYREGPLMKLIAGQYADRQLFVTIRGRKAPASAPVHPSKTYGELYEKVGEQGGFTVYAVRRAANYPDRGLPEIVGFATGKPDLRFHCLPAVPRCSLDDPYRDSTISFSIEREDLAQGRDLMDGIRRVLDQHLT